MAEKKKKRVDVSSSSFKEIVDGEIVSPPAPQSDKKILGGSGKPEHKSDADENARLESDRKFLMRSGGEAAKKPGKGRPESGKSVREGGKGGFKVIENGEYVDGDEKVANGDIVEAPESRKRAKAEKPGGRAKAEVSESEAEKVERSLRNSSAEGIFSSASGSIQSSYTTPFALALGASGAEIGILNSFQNLAGTISHVPGAMLTKYFSRKSIWVASQLFSRIFIWIPILLLPFVSVENRVLILIALLALSNFLLFIRSPAWSSLMGDLVPLNVRGKYFGRRNMLVGVSGVVATLAAGSLLVYWGFPAIFLLSMIFAAVAILFFVKMHEPPMARVFHYRYNFSFDPKGWWTQIRVNREFAIFTTFLTFMNFAVDVAAPFYAVYMLKDLNIGYEWFAVAVVVGALARAAMQQYWGRLNDRFGSRKILIICGILSCFIPFVWMMVYTIPEVIFARVFDGAVFSGFELVMFNYLLEVTPAKNRPKYVAAHNFFAGMGTVAGDLFGAFLVLSFQSNGFFWLAGLHAVFFISFVLRLASCSLLLAIKNIDVKQSDLVPVRYVFWQAVAVEPARGIKHALIFTFRYPPKVEQELRTSVRKLEYRLKLKMSK
jgi:MFS family permease